MKLTMEIQGHYAGVSENTKKPGEMVTYTAVWGTDTNGRYARAITYGTVAIALSKAINAMLGENEVVSSKRIVITLNGEWQSRSVTRNGKEEKQRNFVAREAENAPAFNILDGMALEAARLRKDAVDALGKAEKLRSGGQLALAYEAVAQFVANYAGVPLDLEKFLADSAADDAEFGATAATTDPEEAAAAHFAREDRVKETATVTEPDPEAEHAAQEGATFGTVEATETPQKEAEEFGDYQEVLGAVDASAEVNESVAEEDAIVIDAAPADEADVLDDTTAAAEPVEQVAAPQAAPQATPASFGSRPTAFGGRPSAFGSQAAAPASKPFARPEAARPAPQPVARPVPTASERPSALPFGGSRGPKF
ncbi:hypothetical protein OIU34_16730 [Pararhizobium sp. BT-229]|uniref:hypothetical protein n=1 Tax=Pararhizobium sp. BT-229 TaxID=2986923 RepID=UPI0021F710A5|nr:hypothetical protein [Pararhizobium sp. BT-229]MCV9963550.1 hypothetical protein [Pararhizobium sp. BT-229]